MINQQKIVFWYKASRAYQHQHVSFPQQPGAVIWGKKIKDGSCELRIPILTGKDMFIGVYVKWRKWQANARVSIQEIPSCITCVHNYSNKSKPKYKIERGLNLPCNKSRIEELRMRCDAGLFNSVNSVAK